MTIRETADELDKVLTERRDLAQKLVDWMTSACKEMEPLCDIMKKHNLPYRNRIFIGSSMHGFILAQRLYDDNRFFYVTDGSQIMLVNADTDELIDPDIDKVTFFETCDLHDVNAGFEYVLNLDDVAKDMYKRNAELAVFINDNQ